MPFYATVTSQTIHPSNAVHERTHVQHDILSINLKVQYLLKGFEGTFFFVICMYKVGIYSNRLFEGLSHKNHRYTSCTLPLLTIVISFHYPSLHAWMEFNSSVCFCLLIDNLSSVPSCTIVLSDDGDADVGADVVHKQQLW